MGFSYANLPPTPDLMEIQDQVTKGMPYIWFIPEFIN